MSAVEWQAAALLGVAVAMEAETECGIGEEFGTSSATESLALAVEQAAAAGVVIGIDLTEATFAVVVDLQTAPIDLEVAAEAATAAAKLPAATLSVTTVK